MTNMNRARDKRNLRKGRPPKDMDSTDALMATYGNKRQRAVAETVARVQDLRRSSASSPVPSHRVRKARGRAGASRVDLSQELSAY